MWRIRETNTHTYSKSMRYLSNNKSGSKVIHGYPHGCGSAAGTKPKAHATQVIISGVIISGEESPMVYWDILTPSNT